MRRTMADFDVLCLQEVADNWPDLKGDASADQFALFVACSPGFDAIEGVAIERATPPASRSASAT